MINQYIRHFSLNINGDPFIEQMPLQSLRAVFSITVYPFDSISYADIRIFNLSKESIINQKSSIVLTAGYEDNYDEIFTGTVINSLKERDGVNTVTRLMCRSNSIASRGSISGTYGGNSALLDILQNIATAWPISLVIEEDHFSDVNAFTSGYAISGDLPSELNSLATRFGFTWSVDRGSLVVNRNDKQRNTPVIEINQSTGMVGFPEVNRGPQGLGVYVITRINPMIRANSRINIRAEYATYNTGNMFVQELGGDATANGEYNVLSMRYEGDTHGDEWDLHIEALRPNTAMQEGYAGIEQIEGETEGGALVWGDRVDQAFRNKVREIASDLNINPNYLMAVMGFETQYTFSPSIPNGMGSGAVGLIQFMPFTAIGLGTSTAKLAGMTAVQQLDYVKKYYQQYQDKVRTLADAYVAVFYPAALGKPDDAVIFTRPSVGYTQNASLDIDRDGKITKKDLASTVYRSYNLGLKNAR